MRERVVETARSLVVFTVCAQAAAGVAFAGIVARSERLAPALALTLLALGGLVVLLHLGRPARAGLTIANLDTSPLSREVLFGLAFAASLVAWMLVHHDLAMSAAALVAGVLGLLFVHSIAGVYRLRTVPAWDAWTTPASFFGTALVLGPALLALALALSGKVEPVRGLAAFSACMTLIQMLVSGVAAQHVPRSHRRAYQARWATMALGGCLLIAVAVTAARPGLLAAATGLLVASELLGRLLFYASHRRVGL